MFQKIKNGILRAVLALLFSISLVFLTVIDGGFKVLEAFSQGMPKTSPLKHKIRLRHRRCRILRYRLMKKLRQKKRKGFPKAKKMHHPRGQPLKNVTPRRKRRSLKLFLIQELSKKKEAAGFKLVA